MEAVVQASIWSQNHDPQLHAAIEDSLKTEQPAVYDNEAELQRECWEGGREGGREGMGFCVGEYRHGKGRGGTAANQK